jgi:hypothetical protein
VLNREVGSGAAGRRSGVDRVRPQRGTPRLWGSRGLASHVRADRFDDR